MQGDGCFLCWSWGAFRARTSEVQRSKKRKSAGAGAPFSGTGMRVIGIIIVRTYCVPGDEDDNIRYSLLSRPVSCLSALTMNHARCDS